MRSRIALAWSPLTRGVAEAVRPSVPLYLVGTVFFWASMYTYPPILGPYIQSLGGSLQVIGWVLGAYGLTQLLFRLPLGVWSDRLGARKPFVLAGFVASAASGIGLGLVHAPAHLFAFRALAGVAASAWVTFTVLFSSYFTTADARRAMAIMHVCASFAQIPAALLGGWLADRFGWTAPFYAGAVLAGAGLVCMAGVPEESPAGAPAPITLAHVVRLARVRPLGTASAIAALGHFAYHVTVQGFTPIYAVRLGASKGALGVLAMVSLIPSTFAPILGEMPLVRRLRERWIVPLGYLITAGTTLAIPYITTLPLLMASQALGGLGRGLIFPILMSRSIQAIAPSQRATAMGFFQASYSVGMTAGPWMGGLLGAWFGLEAIFVGTAALTTVTALVAYRWLR